MSPELRSILEELHGRLAAHYGERLVRLVLFGSQARGDAEEGSDIDVLVVLQGPVDPCVEIERAGDTVADLCLERNVTIAAVFVSQEDFERERSPLMLNVRREGVAV